MFEFYVKFLRRPLSGTDALVQISGLGLLVGIITGGVILLFRQAIEQPLLHLLPSQTAEGFESLPVEIRFALPLAGALVLGIFLHFMNIGVRKVGVSYVIDRLNNHQGYISLKSLLVQFFCGVTTILSGQSAGREGPAVHLGSACGSLLGQYMRLPNNSIRTLVACGAAAAISASFNTPVAGVIFAMEVVMMEFTITSFTPVIVASVSAAIICQTVYGNAPAFSVGQISLDTLSEIPFILLTGAVVGIAASLFVQLIKRYSRFSDRSIIVRLSIAGLVTGLVAMLYPEIMGVGYDTVNTVVEGKLGLQLLLGVAAAKLFVTAISVGLGVPSGLIGPTLFIGATLGGACGILTHLLWPEASSSNSLYVLLGMAAMMGACLQAPLSALLALIELTYNPHIILPALLAIVVASLIASELFGQKSLFVSILQSQGLSLRNDPISNALRRVSVGAVMERSLKRCKKFLTLEEATSLLKNQPKWLIVEIDEKPASLLPAADLARQLVELNKEDKEQTIDLLAIPAQRKQIQSIYFQATLREALDRFEETGAEALYVERTSAPMITTLLGVLTREDINNYYHYKLH